MSPRVSFGEVFLHIFLGCALRRGMYADGYVEMPGMLECKKGKPKKISIKIN